MAEDYEEQDFDFEQEEAQLKQQEYERKYRAEMDELCCAMDPEEREEVIKKHFENHNVKWDIENPRADARKNVIESVKTVASNEERDDHIESYITYMAREKGISKKEARARANKILKEEPPSYLGLSSKLVG